MTNIVDIIDAITSDGPIGYELRGSHNFKIYLSEFDKILPEVMTIFTSDSLPVNVTN